MTRRPRRRLPAADWWTARPAQNRRASTYTCPICGGLLPSMSEHTLLMPEGDPERRRHAHTQCVMRARRAGRLPTREEFEKAHGIERPPGALRRLWRALQRNG